MSSDISPTSGLLLVDKPQGITSHDAVNRVRRALHVRKVGHAGTLDPLATGLLLIGVGRATRLLRFLGELPKVYEGRGRLGIETSTLDADGDVVCESPVEVGANDLAEEIATLTGDVEQIPPAFSAVKVQGVRLHRAARAGRRLAAPPRRVHVFSFDLLGFEPPHFDFRVVCSGGTYVRSLVAEVGDRVSCGAHLASLRRVMIGPFDVKDARPPDDPGRPLAMESAVGHLPAVILHEDEAKVAVHGCCLGPAGLPGPYRALAPDGRLIGIWRDDGAKGVPEIVLAPAGAQPQDVG